jgi:hypothetical protein
MTRALALGAVMCVFVVLAAPFLDYPVDAYEWWTLCAAEQLVATGLPSLDYRDTELTPRARANALLLSHPPASVYLSAASMRLLGVETSAARVAGVLTVLLTAVLLFELARRVPAGDARHASVVGALAVTLYLLHPATIQGAVYLGFSEGTLLPLTWVLATVVFAATQRRGLLVRGAALGATIALALWAKPATSFALPVGLAIAAVAVDGLAHGLLLALSATTIGALGFLLTWVVYAAMLASRLGVPLTAVVAQPFVYLSGETVIRFSLADHLVDGARLALFAGVVLLVVAARGAIRRITTAVRARRAGPDLLVVVLPVLVVTGYLVVPGGAGNFPKYHLVVMPFVAWLAAAELAPALPFHPWKAGLAIGLGIAYHAALVADPMKLLNHDLRLAALIGDVTPTA